MEEFKFKKTSPILVAKLRQVASPSLHPQSTLRPSVLASPNLLPARLASPSLSPSICPKTLEIEFGEDALTDPIAAEFMLTGLDEDEARSVEPGPTEWGAAKVAEGKLMGETVPEDFENIGLFDIFKIGVGPSSSHTNGPMWAGRRFSRDLVMDPRLLAALKFVRVDLYGSLALTGKGHRTDDATILGLMGQEPPTCDPDKADAEVFLVRNKQTLRFGGEKQIQFNPEEDLLFHMETELPLHPNGMRLQAFDENKNPIFERVYYSIGGGFIKTDEEMGGKAPSKGHRHTEVPHPFRNCVELLKTCVEKHKTIAEVMMENEAVYTCNGDMDLVKSGLDEIAAAMFACVERGLKMDGPMPGSGFPRQSKRIKTELQENPERAICDHFVIMDYVALFARAANEENACGGRVVTAPTNGACGTIPAVLTYYTRFFPGRTPEGVRTFLATAAAIGTLYKRNATISGAEGGCQAEVGSACSMAAAGLASVMGSGLCQIESAAEIGMEHNLGMTCDPLDGLVQVPCIERNSVAAIKAITAARMAKRRCARHLVSLDSCIETMYRTGKDMNVRYRETSQGGLAILAKMATPYSSDAPGLTETFAGY